MKKRLKIECFRWKISSNFIEKCGITYWGIKVSCKNNGLTIQENVLKMGKRVLSSLPQILGFTTISPEGKFKLKKTVLNYFGFNNLQVLYLDSKNELLLTTNKIGERLSVLPNNWLVLPGTAQENLQFKGKTNICFVQRQNGVAIKRYKMTVKKSKRPRIVDIESSNMLMRRVETFGDSAELLNELVTSQVNYKLKFDITDYWKEKKSLSAWKARQLLDIEEETDEELLRTLIQERLSKQLDDGSWEELVTTTAKNLKELAQLGMNSNYPQIQKAIKWLLERPQSPYNPGMFFLTDELVAEQQEIINRRNEQTVGPKERFRKRPRSELKLIHAVDELYYNACGPRILWPNAIVLETLLEYGYEFNERVQTIIDTLTFGGWCECAYQHGPRRRKRTEPLSMKEIEKFEEQTLFEFKHGGLFNFKLLIMQPTWSHLMRLSHKKKGDKVEYTLRMPTHTQGCEVITTGALSKVTNEKLWRLAESHLWRFVVALYNAYNNPYGMDELIKYSLSPYSFLNLFSKYDTTAARLGILLSLPWIIENQNEDGTWGNPKTKNSATIAVIQALKNIDYI